MRNYGTGLIQTKLFIRWMKEDGHTLNPAFSSEMIYIYELNRFRLFSGSTELDDTIIISSLVRNIYFDVAQLTV